MKANRFLVYGLIINLIISLISCNNNKKVFYEKIKENDDCMIACEVVYNGEEPITIVMEKSDIIYKFKKFDQLIDDDFIIKAIKSGKPISVPKELYNKLYYGSQVIAQSRVDSLMNLGIDNFFTTNYRNMRLLDPNLADITLMEGRYAIKKIFEQNILLYRDCESGFYIEIE